jgi:hypothetical protein
MSDFSLRRLVPGHDVGEDANGDNQLDTVTGDPIYGYNGLSTVYHQADIMVHLCRDRKYWRIYGPLDATIRHMQTRVNLIQYHHSARVLPANFIAEVDRRLTEMLNRVVAIDRDIANNNIPTELADQLTGDCCCGGGTASQKLELRFFFQKKFLTAAGAPIGVTGEIARLWREIDDIAPDHLCLPWVRIQTEAGEEVVDPKDMCYHIDDIGDFTLLDLYTEPKTRNRRLVRAIHEARKNRLLTRPRLAMTALAGGRDEILPEGTGGGNNKICGADSKCKTNQGTFCNFDPETGNCSAASG